MTSEAKHNFLLIMGDIRATRRLSIQRCALTNLLRTSINAFREQKIKYRHGYQQLGGLQSLWSRLLWSSSFGKLVLAQPYGLLLGGSRDVRSLTQNLLLACSILPTLKMHASMSPRGVHQIQSLTPRGDG
jgi:hypothetical protein